MGAATVAAGGWGGDDWEETIPGTRTPSPSDPRGEGGTAAVVGGARAGAGGVGAAVAAALAAPAPGVGRAVVPRRAVGTSTHTPAHTRGLVVFHAGTAAGRGGKKNNGYATHT